jgi:hypothetical protein
MPINYVTRELVDNQLVSALTRNQHLVIYGSSKQGKTTVRKYNLTETDYIVVTCSNKWNLGQLHAAILKAAGYTIVQSETRAASGNHKITATVSLGARLFGGGGTAGAAIDKGTEHSQETVETRLDLDPSDVNDIIGALSEIEFQKFIVLEDFHYLPEETQKDFAVALKAFHESSSLIFIIVGVWLQENRLIQFNGDLSGRVSTVNADRWSKDELREAIRLGEEALNVKFDGRFTEVLVARSFDSIYVIQEVCLLACEGAGVFQRQETRKDIGVGVDADVVIATVVERQSARFNDFLTNFATGFGKTDLAMYRWLLVPIIGADSNELEHGLHYRTVRRRLSRVHPQGPLLNAGNVTQALKNTARLQVQQGVKPLVLDYDQSLKRLNVVDRSFLIWLQQQDKGELLEALDLAPGLLVALSEGEEGLEE